MNSRKDTTQMENTAICNESPKRTIKPIDTICGLLLAAGGIVFLMPSGMRAAISKRILEEKEFATLFHDGKFLPLHQEHHSSYMTASSGMSDWLRTIQSNVNIETKVSKALKEEHLSYRTLWNAMSFKQRLAGFFSGGLAIAGLGITIRSLPPAQKPATHEPEPIDTVIPLGLDGPQHQITNVLAERLKQHINTPML